MADEHLQPKSKEKYPDIIFIKVPELTIRKGGIVVNEERALRSPCHGYKMSLNGKTSEIVWCPGIVGALSEAEKEKYCKQGIRWEEMPSELERRWRILHKAGIFKEE